MEDFYVNNMFQVQNPYGQVTKHIFVGETRIASRVSGFDPLTVDYNDTFYYHPDHLGSTSFVSRADGSEFEQIEYTPYGETWVQEGGSNHKIRYMFTSKELDEETNLYYFGARYYDQQVSRWMSVDPALGSYLPITPIGGEERQSKQRLPGLGGVFNFKNLNFYHYSGNNPIKYTDPTGNAYEATMGYTSIAGPIALAEPTFFGEIIFAIGFIGVAAVDTWITFGPQIVAMAQYLPALVDQGNALVNRMGSFMNNNKPDPKDVIEKIKQAFDKIRNNIRDHLTEMDNKGAIKELNGGITKIKSNGKPFYHVNEVKDALKGVTKGMDKIKELLHKDNLSPETRELLEKTLSETSKYIDNLNNYIKSQVK